ncbi:MAG TPA: transglycosylase domain-containing protein, partial [Candidatus Obscuribacterales bacterium]
GHVVEGGSTITQQLAGSMFLDRTEISLARKIKEAILAWDIEHRYTKEKILEAYLNEVYYGAGAYGIERAAQRYFNKHASQLNIGESAFLAGLLKAPSILGAPQNRRAAIERQQVVIEKMREYGMVSPQQADKARATPLVFEQGPHRLRYPYYIEQVLAVLRSELGDENLWKSGWRVYTNLDVDAQRKAERVLNERLKNAPKGVDQGALVSMSLNDAAVIALVGGKGSFEHSQWNRAIFPHTAGSAFKPFVYLAALTYGAIQPDTPVADAPIVIHIKGSPPYAPKNFDNEFKGTMPARKALALSRNVCSVRIAQNVGLDRIIKIARAAGIESPLEPYPSLALGYCAVSPLEMTTAYATLARGGIYMKPQFVRRIESEDAKDVRDYVPTPHRALHANPVAQLVDMMQDVVAYGTGTRAKLPGLAVAGKTGTADQSKDIWFIGFTPDTITTVWAGNDQNKSVKGRAVTGGAVMAAVWHDYMQAYYQTHVPPKGLAFAAPEKPMIIEQAARVGNPVLFGDSYGIFGQAAPSANEKKYVWDQKPPVGAAHTEDEGGERVDAARKASAQQPQIAPHKVQSPPHDTVAPSAPESVEYDIEPPHEAPPLSDYGADGESEW